MPALILLAFFLFGMAAGRVTGTVYAGGLWQRMRERTRRRSGLVLDSIDKRVQSLCPQVWRQRRLSDAQSATSTRNAWKRARGRQEGVSK